MRRAIVSPVRPWLLRLFAVLAAAGAASCSLIVGVGDLAQRDADANLDGDGALPDVDVEGDGGDVPD